MRNTQQKGKRDPALDRNLLYSVREARGSGHAHSEPHILYVQFALMQWERGCFRVLPQQLLLKPCSVQCGTIAIW